MPLTPEQKTTLRNAILADSELNVLPQTADGAIAIAKLLNRTASPNYTVWKTNVSVTQVGDNFVGTELAGVSSLNQSRLQTIAQYSPAGINPSLADRRAFFDDIFSGAGGVLTRAKLLILWKRLALRVEKIFATGTGSDASPATLGYEGMVSGLDVRCDGVVIMYLSEQDIIKIKALVEAARPFLSGRIVDETSGTIQLMDTLSSAVDDVDEVLKKLDLYTEQTAAFLKGE